MKHEAFVLVCLQAAGAVPNVNAKCHQIKHFHTDTHTEANTHNVTQTNAHKYGATEAPSKVCSVFCLRK